MQLPVAEDLLKNAENFAQTVGHLLNTDTNATSINITKDNFSMTLYCITIAIHITNSNHVDEWVARIVCTAF